MLAYLNIDQSGYIKPGTIPQIGIMMDFTDGDATDFLRLTAQTYTNVSKIIDTSCGCKDLELIFRCLH